MVYEVFGVFLGKVIIQAIDFNGGGYRNRLASLLDIDFNTLNYMGEPLCDILGRPHASPAPQV